jgi:hypothetical protein
VNSTIPDVNPVSDRKPYYPPRKPQEEDEEDLRTSTLGVIFRDD